MRRFTLAAVLAGVVSLGLGSTADAQVVIGTRPAYAPGTVVSPAGVIAPPTITAGSVYSSGYYSPYPGYLYSPFATQSFANGFGNPFWSGGALVGNNVFWNGGNWNGNGMNWAYRRRANYYTHPSGGVLHANPYFHVYGRY